MPRSVDRSIDRSQGARALLNDVHMYLNDVHMYLHHTKHMNQQTYDVRAARDLRAGEELTCDYTLVGWLDVCWACGWIVIYVRCMWIDGSSEPHTFKIEHRPISSTIPTGRVRRHGEGDGPLPVRSARGRVPRRGAGVQGACCVVLCSYVYMHICLYIYIFSHKYFIQRAHTRSIDPIPHP